MPLLITLAVRTVTMTPGRRMLSYSADCPTRLSPTIEIVTGIFGRPSRVIVHDPASAVPVNVDLTVSGVPSRTDDRFQVPAKSASVGAAGGIGACSSFGVEATIRG